MGESAFKVYLLVVILVIDDGSKFVWMRSWGSVDNLGRVVVRKCGLGLSLIASSSESPHAEVQKLVIVTRQLERERNG